MAVEPGRRVPRLMEQEEVQSEEPEDPAAHGQRRATPRQLLLPLGGSAAVPASSLDQFKARSTVLFEESVEAKPKDEAALCKWLVAEHIPAALRHPAALTADLWCRLV